MSKAKSPKNGKQPDKYGLGDGVMSTTKPRKNGKQTRGIIFTDKRGITFYWSEELQDYVTVPDSYDLGMAPVIGAITWYTGSDRRFSDPDTLMLITGVFRYDEPEDSPDRFITDNIRLEQLGGIRSVNGVEVHVWNGETGEWGAVGEEITDITELEMFQDIRLR